MSQSHKKIREWHQIDSARFQNEIANQYCPAVLRGVVSDWPAVQHARQSMDSFCKYVAAFDNGQDVDALLMPPEVRGRIFYNNDMSGFNYLYNRLPVSAVIGQLLRYARIEHPPSVAVQSALISDCLPGFLNENQMPLLDAGVAPRIWIGNRVITPAHFDESNNIACVVAGRRRFTLFPPEQISNLYIGPLGFAPTGTPISMVSFRDPDFTKYPRFREALAHAEVAELLPGDAIYIPTLWWHHVESLENCNALVNYWWKGNVGSRSSIPSALDCLLHSIVNLNYLPPEQKAAWRAIYDHYVFNETNNAAEHIPEHRRGVLGEISPELATTLRAFLISQLNR